MEQRRQAPPKPPPLPAAAEPAPAPVARADGELSDEDLQYVVGGLSADAHQYLETGLPTPDD